MSEYPWWGVCISAGVLLQMYSDFSLLPAVAVLAIFLAVAIIAEFRRQ